MTSRLVRFLVVLSGVTCSAGAWAAPCPTRDNWPTVDWPKKGTTGKEAEIKALEDYAFTLLGEDRERLGIRTDGLVIIKGGNIVYERYARGWSPNKRHMSWSVAKSISSALIGVAVHQKALELEDSICTYLPEYQNKGVCEIKVKHVLTSSMGLQWQEQYENSVYQTSSVIAMLYGIGHRDQTGFVLDQNQTYLPGTQFIYSTGYSAVAASIAKRALKPTFGNDALWSEFFDRIGMRSTVFEEDPKGHPMGGGYVFATVRDYAKFGYLYLNDGCWANERVLPENWVTQSTTINEAYKSNRGHCTQDVVPPNTYELPCETTPVGYMWWLNQPGIEGETKPFKDLPPDAYLAIGHWGQYVVVVPSADVVIVRVGDDRRNCPATAVNGKVNGVSCDFDINTLSALALEVAK